MSEAENAIQRIDLPPEALTLFKELETSKADAGKGYLVLDDLLMRHRLSVQGLYLLLRSFVDFSLLESWTIEQSGRASFVTYKLSLAVGSG